METVKTYLLSILGAAMVCTIISRFTGKNANAAVIKMASGLLLLLTVLRPFAGFHPVLRNDISFDIESQASAAVQHGEVEMQKALSKIIKEKTTAYILQKARTLHADITVDVILTDETMPVPERVRISGKIAPYAKQQLQNMMEQELGIAKENQIWT